MESFRIVSSDNTMNVVEIVIIMIIINFFIVGYTSSY